MEHANQPFHAAAPWLWAGFSAGAVAASALLAFVVAGAASSAGLGRGADGDLVLRLDLAFALAIAGGLSMAGVIAAARLCFGRWLAITAGDLVVPLIGVGLAATFELALHAWGRGRFGYYDADMIGLTAVLSPLLVLVAVATFGALVAPRGASTAPKLMLALVSACVYAVVVSNVGGLRDGIGSDGWALAICVGLSAVYVLVGIAVAWRSRG